MCTGEGGSAGEMMLRNEQELFAGTSVMLEESSIAVRETWYNVSPTVLSSPVLICPPFFLVPASASVFSLSHSVPLYSLTTGMK